MDDNTPLFQNADEEERLWAPQQIPGDAEVAADENGGFIPVNHKTIDAGDVPVPVLSGTNIAAAPMSDNFDPGLENEEEEIDEE